MHILTKCLEEKQAERWRIQELVNAIENELSGVKIDIGNAGGQMLRPKVPSIAYEEIIPLSDTMSILTVANLDELVNFNGDKNSIMKIILKQVKILLYEREQKSLPQMRIYKNQKDLEIFTRFTNLVELEIIMDQICCLTKEEMVELSQVFEKLPLIKVTLVWRIN